MEGFGGLVGASAPRQQGERNLALRTNQRPSANGGCHPRNRNRIANTNVGGQARNFKGSFTHDKSRGRQQQQQQPNLVKRQPRSHARGSPRCTRRAQGGAG